MDTRDRIFKLLAGGKRKSATQLAEILGVSRQAVSKQLRHLVSSGRIIKQGVTKGACFRLATRHQRAEPQGRFAKTLPLAKLEEDAVFFELGALLSLRALLSSDALSLVQYAFTELLNNAIEHSASRHCRVDFTIGKHDVLFIIRDFGIGVFYSIYSKFALADESAAVVELLKGKATTMASRHSGEGIFFSCKAADVLTIRSHNTCLEFETKKGNIRVIESRFLRGTEVRFTVSARSRRKLDLLFKEFAPREFDYKFDKTRLLVRIQTNECVSRSEAKRITHRLASFKRVELDFKGVAVLGQGFADELFRVFLRANPGLRIELRNLKPALRAMVKHALDDDTAERVTLI